MNEWIRRAVTTLLVIVVVFGLVRLAWEILRPAVPALIGLIVFLTILRLIWRRPQGW